jgi:hypothetical protein
MSLPLLFDPQPAPAPAPARKPVEFDWDAIEGEINKVEAKNQLAQQQELAKMQEIIRTEVDPFKALPVQGPDSAYLHSAIVQAFEKRHKIGASAPQPVVRRKVSLQKARQKARAQAHNDKTEQRQQHSLVVKKQRNKVRSAPY